MLCGEELRLAEDHPGGGVEAVVVKLHEGAPEQREPVEYLAAREDHARIAGEAEVAAHLRVLVGPPERQAELRPACYALEHGDVEVSDVPAGQDVRVDGAEMREERRDARPLARHEVGGDSGREAGQRAGLAGAHDPDVVPAVAGRRDRVEEAAVEARLDVERQDPEARLEGGGLEARVPVHAAHPRPALEGPVHHERAADPVVDEVPVREPNVRFE